MPNILFVCGEQQKVVDIEDRYITIFNMTEEIAKESCEEEEKILTDYPPNTPIIFCKEYLFFQHKDEDVFEGAMEMLERDMLAIAERELNINKDEYTVDFLTSEEFPIIASLCKIVPIG